MHCKFWLESGKIKDKDGMVDKRWDRKILRRYKFPLLVNFKLGDLMRCQMFSK